MTTNVLDLRHDIAASDSRWSIETDELIAYVDNTGFEKIEVVNRYVVLFAGSSFLIQLWKDWFRCGFQGDRPPEMAGNLSIAMTITDMETSVIHFERLQRTPAEDVRFAGSGAVHAMRCWMTNFCAKRAVSSAILLDCLSGGNVLYQNFNGDNNVNSSSRVEAILSLMATRGMIMYKHSTNGAIPIQDAAANDSKARELLEQISNGSVVACAPCEEMFIPWTSEEKHTLDRALAKMMKHR